MRSSLFTFVTYFFALTAITAQGFMTTLTNWNIPTGGYKSSGYDIGFNKFDGSATYSDDNGSQSWSITDINGDGKKDLVVCAEKQNGSVTTYSPTGNPYWKVYLNSGSNFSATAITWNIPVGGYITGGINYGFNKFTGQATYSDDNGCQSWSVLDMDGDGKKDLVVYAETQSSTVKTFDPAGNPYWKVYLNTGTGFSTTATNWIMPIGGYLTSGIRYGYNRLTGTATYLDDDGSESWSVIDINGDGKQDLVIPAETQSSSVKTFDPTGNPFWKVYFNSGTGFYTTAVNWNIPIGGSITNSTNYGFNKLSGTATYSDNDGSQSWSVVDMDGDGKQDLVIPAETQSSSVKTYSPTSNPYWKVYFNLGTGFSATAVNWSIPVGGYIANSTNYGFNKFTGQATYSDDNGSQSWNMADMNGDGKQDLIIPAETQGAAVKTFDPTGNPYWKVYFNSGTGFSTNAANWTMPLGGSTSSLTNYGFNKFTGTAFYSDDDGSQSWMVADINGDGKQDLVITAETQSSIVKTFSPASNPYWKVFLNSSTTSVFEAAASTSFSLYPNPAKELFTVNTNGVMIDELYIRDVTGKNVFFTNTIKNSFFSMNIGDIAKGIYSVTIRTKEGISVKKLVIQ